jgi:hypothetical protein
VAKKRNKSTAKKINTPKQKVYQNQFLTKELDTFAKYLIISKKILSSFLFWITFVITVGGFLFLVYPKVSVDPGPSLITDNPLRTPFIIENKGNLPIKDLHWTVEVDKITSKFVIIKDIDFVHDSNVVPKLDSGESSSIFLRTVNIPPNFFEYAEVYIKLTYRPYWIPYTFTQNIRFKTERKSTGEYIWLKYFSEK